MKITKTKLKTMNKTSTVNIAGVIFNIEDDAFELLKEYNNAIRAHFINSPDGMEIVSDIESRIAELFSEILRTENRNVIIAKDVKFVIERLGSVSDFTFDNEEEEESIKNEKEPKKLYRSTNNKILGGVCGGIADFLNADPTWIRIIAIILVFLYGSGVIAYVILWIVLPTGETENNTDNPKRSLYRDSENKRITGVCAGLGKYFNIDPTWVRLIFVVLLLFPLPFSFKFHFINLIPFSSISAFSITVYVLLSIIVPEAKTVADKMAMEGEPDNLNGIIRNAGKAKESPKANKGSNFFDSLFSAIGSIFKFIGLIIAKSSGIFLLVFGIVSIVIIIILSVLFFTYYDTVFNYDFVNANYRILSVVLIVINLGILAFGILYLAAKILWNTSGINKILGFSLLGIWLTSVALITYLVAVNMKALNKEVLVEEKQAYTINGNTLYLEQLFEESNVVPGIKSILSENISDFTWRAIRLNIEKSPDNRIYVIQKMKARGENTLQAATYAENINYKYNVTDSLISLSKYFTIEEDTPVRLQRLGLIIQVPVDTKINITSDFNYEHPFYRRCEAWKYTSEGLKCDE